jgi:hypothetical protein
MLSFRFKTIHHSIVFPNTNSTLPPNLSKITTFLLYRQVFTPIMPHNIQLFADTGKKMQKILSHFQHIYGFRSKTGGCEGFI